MHSKKFKLNPISAVIASTFLAGATHQAVAQDNNVEEVIVTGIRASLQQSMDIKRDSSGVVDAITAEDIGKFPDSNLAESLQRITGVSISRANGEGQQVTVRGFGGDFNMVTLNGRIMPASATPTRGAASSRAFEFGNLASESVSGVEVYKTGKANIATGGIGATINLKTNKPLENPGMVLNLGGKIVKDSTNRIGDDLTPELSGIFSWTNDDSNLGISLSASHQQRSSSSAGSYVSQWRTREWDGSLNVVDGGLENAPDAGQLYSIPSDVRYTLADRERTRNNMQLVLQWQASERVRTTLDYTFAENELLETRAEQMLWYNQNADRVVFDTNEPVATPVFYSEDINGAKDIGFAQQDLNQTNELTSLGLNVDFQVNDNFLLTFDYHDSSSEGKPTAGYGGNALNNSIGANVVGAQWTDFSGDLPIMNITIDDANLNNNGQLDPSDLGTQVFNTFNTTSITDVEQIRLDGVLEFDNGKIEFGLESRAMSNHALRAQNQNVLGDWGIANPGEIPEEYISPINFASIFSDYSTVSSFTGEQTWSVGYDADPIVLGNWAAGQYDRDVSGSTAWDTDRLVEEDVTALYFQVSMQGELGGMETNFVAGLRYEDTDVVSTAAIRIPSSFTWTDNNDFRLNRSDDFQPLAATASYDHMLPNLDFDIAFTDNVKGRFSYSKTIARATYNYLNSGISGLSVTGPTTPGVTTATANASNPSLVPLESNNVDLSVEWYYDETSYVSFGLYEKRVNNFIGTVPVSENHFGLRDATAGPRAQAARAALEARPDHDGIIDETELFVMTAVMENNLNYDNVDPVAVGSDYDIEPNADDPLLMFLTNKPVNNEEAKIDGFEFAVQHFFGDSGFGLQMNYTEVNGDVNFDNTSLGEQFALVGLSDTANLVAMYENFGIQARLAYNWRDKYLNNTNRFQNNPEYVEDYTQIDLNVSYEINDDLTVFFEGLNLNGENTRKYGRSPRQLWNLEELGARYQIGVRYAIF